MTRTGGVRSLLEGREELVMGSKNQDFLQSVLDQVGDRVKAGTEVAAGSTDSAAWDSGELVEWAANRAGATMPDGSWRQFNALRDSGHSIDPEVALRTPGALLFKFSSDPARGIPAERQVMISLGDGRVIDASGKHVQVSAANAAEFSHAATIPEFSIDADEQRAVRELVDGRIGAVDAASSVQPPSAATTPQTPPSTPVDPIALRKLALDEHQRGEALLADRASAETRRDRLEAEAHEMRTGAQVKRDEARATRDAAEAAQKASEGLTGDARDAKVAEAGRLTDDATRFEQEAAAIDAQVADKQVWIDRAQAGIESLRTRAESSFDTATMRDRDSEAAVLSQVPGTQLDAPLGATDVLEVPAPPPQGASVDDIKKWIGGREDAEASMERAAAQHHRAAAQLSDVAETKAALAANALARADSLGAAITAEQQRLEALEARQAAAKAQADRLTDEGLEEHARFETLKARNDPGAEASSQRATEIMRQQMDWTSEAHTLGERITQSRNAMAQHVADQADFRQIGTELNDEARTMRETAANESAAAAKLQAEAASLDRQTDSIEKSVNEAIDRGVATSLHVVVDGEAVEVDVPGRNPADMTDQEIDDLGLPGWKSNSADQPTGPGSAATPQAEPPTAANPPVGDPEVAPAVPSSDISDVGVDGVADSGPDPLATDLTQPFADNADPLVAANDDFATSTDAIASEGDIDVG